MHEVPYPTLDFGGHALTLRSAQGPQSTILQPDGGGGILLFESGEGPDTVVDGFTLRGVSQLDFPFGLALIVRDSSPTIRNCVFAGNRAVGLVTSGSAVGIRGGYLRMENCTITGNLSNNDSGSGAGGLSVGGGASVLLERCVLHGNCARDAQVINGSLTLNCCIVGSVYVDAEDGQVTYLNDIPGDPLFCDPPFCGDLDIDPSTLRVDASSPALPENNACGVLIGALGVGCPPADLPGQESTSARLALSRPWPNPSSGAFRFELNLLAAGEVRVDLHDAQGRHFAQVFSGRLPVGGHQLSHRWDDAPIASPGLLWLRAVLPGPLGPEVHTQRVVRVR